MKNLVKVTVCLLILLFLGCNKEDGADNKVTAKERQDIVLTKTQAGYVQEGNTFACKILSDVLAQQKGSFMISPLSIRYALSMLANGASGITLDELMDLLNCDSLEIGDVNCFCKYLTEELLKADNTVEISLANALVNNSAYSGKMGLKKSYTSAMENYYDALINSYDFYTDNANAIKAINSWADKNTHGMIPDLISNLDGDTYLLLMNALFFKGNWNSNVDFKKSDTRKEEFEQEEGGKKIIDIMRMEGSLAYTANEVCGILELPYGNGAFRMQVLLPNEGKKVADVAEWLKAGGTYNFFPAVQVKLKMPKFETGAGVDLSQILREYIPSSFSASADFSEMTDAPVVVSKVYQKSKIQLDEVGTESAAVTVVEMISTSPGPGGTTQTPQVIEFYATHPFVYIIREVSTGVVLFAGAFRGE